MTSSEEAATTLSASGVAPEFQATQETKAADVVYLEAAVQLNHRAGTIQRGLSKYPARYLKARRLVAGTKEYAIRTISDKLFSSRLPELTGDEL
jgi:hypothetical protein